MVFLMPVCLPLCNDSIQVPSGAQPHVFARRRPKNRHVTFTAHCFLPHQHLSVINGFLVTSHVDDVKSTWCRLNSDGVMQRLSAVWPTQSSGPSDSMTVPAATVALQPRISVLQNPSSCVQHGPRNLLSSLAFPAACRRAVINDLVDGFWQGCRRGYAGQKPLLSADFYAVHWLSVSPVSRFLAIFAQSGRFCHVIRPSARPFVCLAHGQGKTGTPKTPLYVHMYNLNFCLGKIRLDSNFCLAHNSIPDYAWPQSGLFSSNMQQLLHLKECSHKIQINKSWKSADNF